MKKLVNTEEIRSFEKEYIEKNGRNASLKLMEKAGSGLADIISKYKEPYLIVCGKGNNGGDGIVAARYLNSLGKKVSLILTSEETELSSDSKINFNLIKDKVNFIKLIHTINPDFINSLKQSNTVVDCILGTGIKDKLSGLYKEIITSIHDSKKIVIACDIPTGVDPNTGNISNPSIKANVTVTFAYPKIGLMIFPGKENCGEIKVIDIGLAEINSDLFLLEDDFVKNHFPKRKTNSNKGSFGKTLLVCGSESFPGAALLASKAAAMIGSGLTALSSPKEVFNQITSGIPEVTHVEFSLNSILEESKKSNAIVIGPGLGNKKDIKELVYKIIQNVTIPIVLDADGINVLENDSAIIKKVKNDIVLTPHPKEFARISGKSLDEVINNKLFLARQFSKDFNCTLVLKGAGSIITNKKNEVFISPFANSALAKGGTGDVLAGFIGGLISQGVNPEIASCLGVYIHGKCAELISEEKTEYSLLPEDLINYLPKTLKCLL